MKEGRRHLQAAERELLVGKDIKRSLELWLWEMEAVGHFELGYDQRCVGAKTWI